MAGLQGSVMQMVNHGLSTGALFLLVGMLYDRRHTRLISDYGGLWQQMPVYAVFFLVVMFSSIGLPGLNGFVGEFLILLGTFETHRVAAIFAALGIILGAVYMLWMYQRVMYGDLTHDANRRLPDMSGREIALLLPIVVLMFWIGIYPHTFLRQTDASATYVLEQARTQQGMIQPRLPRLDLALEGDQRR
jgi:NADH-quinone oxidoreductase subunit M